MTPRPDEPLLPERVTMGLLPYINAHALDEDYAQAAERGAADDSSPSRSRVGLMGAAALTVFAILAITAGVQTSRDSVTDERDRQALAQEVRERTATLKVDREREASLSSSNKRLEAALLHSSRDSTGLVDQIGLLNLRSGTSAVQGPGVQVTADDAPSAQTDRNKVLDVDLQKLVNGLWQAGAEAISVNGQRLTALSAIRHAGEAITVNYKSIDRPYTILAIGDPKTLPARFADSSSGQTWLDLQRDVGLRFVMRTQKKLRLPGASVPVLRYANQDSTSDERNAQ